MMTKISNAEMSGVLQVTSNTIRELSAENTDLRTKLAQYEKRDHAEKIASAMDEKGLSPELSHKEKVAGLMQRDDLQVVERAVEMNAPQMKLASVAEGQFVAAESEGGQNDATADDATNAFALGLANT
jgi:hypothetical protein